MKSKFLIWVTKMINLFRLEVFFLMTDKISFHLFFNIFIQPSCFFINYFMKSNVNDIQNFKNCKISCVKLNIFL